MYMLYYFSYLIWQGNRQSGFVEMDGRKAAVSHWLAWIALGFTILLLLKFWARKGKRKSVTRIFK